MTRPTTTASNLFRRFLCPGSARMEAGLPEEDSEQAIEGRFLHQYYAHPEWMRDTATPFHKDLLQRADELTNQAILTIKRDRDPIVFANAKEYRETNMEMLGSNIAFAGRPDLARYYLPGEAAIILDLKFGYLNVEPPDVNLQLRAYAVLSYDFSPTKVIYVGIIQPRAPYGPLTLAKYYPEDIEDSRQQIISILEASAKPDAPLNPSETACRYCKAKMICPAYRSAMIVPIGTITPDRALSKAAKIRFLEQELAKISDMKLEHVHEAVALARMIKDSLRDEERKRINAGGYTNFTLSKETEVREVTDVRKAIALLSLAGLEKQEIFDCVNKLSLTDLGETLRKKHPTWDWQQVRDWVNEKLKGVIEVETRKARVLRK